MYAVPAALDTEVATAKLASMGLRTDELSAEQRAYRESWRHGG